MRTLRIALLQSLRREVRPPDNQSPRFREASSSMGVPDSERRANPQWRLHLQNVYEGDRCVCASARAPAGLLLQNKNTTIPKTKNLERGDDAQEKRYENILSGV